MIVGYDPERVARLASRCREALGSLRSIRCDDPAAADATTAAHRLEREIESGILTAVDDLRRRDPLSGAGTARPLPMRFADASGPSAQDSPTATNAADLFTALAVERALAETAELTDDEFFAELDDEWATMSADAGTFDGIDPTLAGRLAVLATDLEQRITRDGDLTQRLAAWATANPLAAVVVSHLRLTSSVTIDVTAAIVGDLASGRTRLGLRSDAVDRLLERLSTDPVAALDAIGRPGLIESLVRWDQIGSPHFTTGAEQAAALVDAAFSAPSTYEFGTREVPETAGEATARAIAALVALTESDVGDRGLPGPLSSAYTAGLVPLLPQLVHSFDGDGIFRLRRPDESPIDVELGATTDEMVDLLGGLSRDSDARAALIGSIAVLGNGIDSAYTADQLAGFSVTLGRSMANEKLEDIADARDRRERTHAALALLKTAVDASRLGGPVATVATGAAVGLAGWFVEAGELPDDPGLESALAGVEAMLVIGVATRVAADHRRRPRPDDTFDEIALQLDRLAGSERADPGLDIDGEIDLLRDLLRRGAESSALDPEVRREVSRHVAALDHDGFASPPFSVSTGQGPDR